MKAVILCAGRGERLQPLTNTIPKPMIPIGDRPLLEYIVSHCKKHGILDIAINTSYLPKQIQDYFGNGKKLGVNIKYSFEEQLQGTSGALNNFRDFLDEPFFVMHGDNLTDMNLTAMKKNHDEMGVTASMLVYRPTEVDLKMGPGYVILDDKGIIIEMIEKPNPEQRIRIESIPLENRAINSGVYYFNKEVMNYIPTGISDFGRDIFPALLRDKHKIKSHQVDGYYKEVGQMSRYLESKEEIESGKVKLNI